MSTEAQTGILHPEETGDGFGDSFVESPTHQADTSATHLLAEPSEELKSNRFSDQFTDSLLPDEFTFETRDSVSSEDQLANLSDVGTPAATSSPMKPAQKISVTAVVNTDAITATTWERFEGEEEPELTDVHLSETASLEAEPAVIDVTPLTANGVSEQRIPTPQPKPAGNWEKFEEPVSKAVQKKLPLTRDDHGTVCAADAMVGDSRWMALDDSRQDFFVESQDAESLPFRKTQSMRATTNRKVQIVDALRQRRLSNSSLDRVPLGGQGQFENEDELTRRFTVEREWQVFVKMDKRVPGTRTKWLPVNVSVKDGVLIIKRNHPPSMPLSSSTAIPFDSPPLHEIRLHHNHVITNPIPRSYDRKSKVHQIKLRQTQVHERRTLKRWLFVEHVSTGRTIVKIGCPDLSLVQSLSDQITEAIRLLPVTRQQGIAYRMNEVFIDVKDYSEILMNCDGTVLERKSLNRIYVQAFLNHSPECKLVLNDIEAILLQGKGQMTNSMSRQVRLTDVVLHPCVDQTTYKNLREVKFTPVDGYPFELLRCSVEPYISPPLVASALMEYNETRNSVRISASLNVRKKLNIRLRPIKDLVMKFPIPSSWSPLFLAEGRFGGKHSVRSTSALRGSFRRKVRTRSCQIETQLGSAMYEPEHGAVMWRVGSYLRTDTQHTFRCDVQLKSGEILYLHVEQVCTCTCSLSVALYLDLPCSSRGMYPCVKCTCACSLSITLQFNIPC